MKHALLLLVPFLAACGNPQKDELAPGIPGGRATGRLGGTPWTASSAVARPTASGYDVVVAGMGEQITCSSQYPTQPYLSFLVPNQLGRYEFDLANPSNSSSPVFLYFPFPGGTDVVTPRTSVVELRSISSLSLSGAVSAESPQSGNRSGSVSGSFEAVICGTPL